MGNIGSHTVLALARMGIKNIIVYDDDVVEEHNLASQAYRVKDLGKHKVEAILEQALELQPDGNFTAVPTKFEPSELKAGDILVSAVDSMEARRDIADMLPGGVYVIDGRMGGGQIEVWSQHGVHWHGTLKRDGDEDPCSARFISYTSYVIAGLIANQVKRYLMQERVASRILMHMNTLQLIVEFPEEI